MTKQEWFLKWFGWIPIPSSALKLLPRRYKEKIATNLLNTMEEENLMPEIVQIIIDQIEKKGYDKSEGVKFKNTEDEIKEALDRFPQLQPYKVYFSRWCERKRRENGLPV